MTKNLTQCEKDELRAKWCGILLDHVGLRSLTTIQRLEYAQAAVEVTKLRMNTDQWQQLAETIETFHLAPVYAMRLLWQVKNDRLF